jgi:hypothetical protein
VAMRYPNGGNATYAVKGPARNTPIRLGGKQTLARSASIHLEFAVVPAPAEILSLLFEVGWGYDYHGEIAYLPVGDDELFNWRTKPLDGWSRVQSLIDTKAQNNEPVGLGLAWRDSQVGGTFYLKPQGEMMVVLDADRPRLEGCDDFTDMSWYLSRILRPLIAGGIPIQFVRCLDGE